MRDIFRKLLGNTFTCCKYYYYWCSVWVLFSDFRQEAPPSVGDQWEPAFRIDMYTNRYMKCRSVGDTGILFLKVETGIFIIVPCGALDQVL